MCWNKGRLCWKTAKLFYFCHLKKLVRPETFGPYYVCRLATESSQISMQRRPVVISLDKICRIVNLTTQIRKMSTRCYIHNALQDFTAAQTFLPGGNTWYFCCQDCSTEWKYFLLGNSQGKGGIIGDLHTSFAVCQDLCHLPTLGNLQLCCDKGVQDM